MMMMMMIIIIIIIIGTSHIVREVIQAETWSLSGGVHHWLKRRSTREERKPVTRENNNKFKLLINPLPQSAHRDRTTSCSASQQNCALYEKMFKRTHLKVILFIKFQQSTTYL
jgi:hypothetical protein